MALERKSRTSNPFVLQGTRTEWYGSTKIDTPYGPQAHSDKQVTFSEKHAWPREKGTGRDVGGPFETIKVERTRFTWEPSQVFTFGGSWARVYEGNIFFKNPHHWPTLDGLSDDQLRSFVPSLSDGNLAGMGSTAISLCAPTNPVVDGSVALAELYREGIPRMGLEFITNPKRYLRRPIKKVSGDYLGYEFGWRPLISEIRNVAKTVVETEAILKQLQRDSGKNVRRRYHFPTIRTASTTVDQLAPWPTLNSGYWTGQRTIAHDNTYRKVWFSGCFTYHFEPDKMAEVEKWAAQSRLLLGVELTPETLWNLFPFSWLSDWFANTGHVLNNVSLFSQDGLTLRYGYTMEETRREHFESVGRIQTSYGSVPPEIAGGYVVTRKRRAKAWPFSLGLTGLGLENRQWAILSALGISSMPGRF